MIRLRASVPAKILVCQRVLKKSAVLACLTMAKLKLNQRVPNKNADLLKKISLMGTELRATFLKKLEKSELTHHHFATLTYAFV